MKNSRLACIPFALLRGTFCLAAFLVGLMARAAVGAPLQIDLTAAAPEPSSAITITFDEGSR